MCKLVPMDGLLTESQLSHEQGKVIFESQVLVELNAEKAGGKKRVDTMGLIFITA